MKGRCRSRRESSGDTVQRRCRSRREGSRRHTRQRQCLTRGRTAGCRSESASGTGAASGSAAAPAARGAAGESARAVCLEAARGGCRQGTAVKRQWSVRTGMRMQWKHEKKARPRRGAALPPTWGSFRMLRQSTPSTGTIRLSWQLAAVPPFAARCCTRCPHSRCCSDR